MEPTIVHIDNNPDHGFVLHKGTGSYIGHASIFRLNVSTEVFRKHRDTNIEKKQEPKTENH